MGKKISKIYPVFLVLLFFQMGCKSSKKVIEYHKDLKQILLSINDPLQETDCRKLLFDPMDHIFDGELYKLNALIRKKLYNNKWDFYPPGYSSTQLGCPLAKLNMEILELGSRKKNTPDQLFKRMINTLDLADSSSYSSYKILSYLCKSNQKYLSQIIDKYIIQKKLKNDSRIFRCYKNFRWI